MFDVLIKALGFVIVIVIGFLLKQFRILKKEDGYTLATIIMNVTLPCALFSNANGITINGAMIVLILMGIILNVLMVAIGYFVSNGKSAPTRAAYMINCSGYNIGNFVLPFVQPFFLFFCFHLILFNSITWNINIVYLFTKTNTLT